MSLDMVPGGRIDTIFHKWSFMKFIMADTAVVTFLSPNESNNYSKAVAGQTTDKHIYFCFNSEIFYKLGFRKISGLQKFGVFKSHF